MKQPGFVFMCILLVLSFAPLVSAGHWTDWEWVKPRPQVWHLVSVADNGTTVVAVGLAGSIVFSEDGADWEVVMAEDDGFLLDVIWAENQFVVVGTGQIATSPDGKSWTTRLRYGDAVLRGVAWSGSGFLALGENGLCFSSSEGVEWENCSADQFPHADFKDVIWDGFRYVAVGRVSGHDNATVLFSDDGREWEYVPPSVFFPMAITEIARGNSRYVVAGGRFPSIPETLWSDDGEIWNHVPIHGYGGFADLAYLDDKFVAVGSSGLFASSKDGVEWSFANNPDLGTLAGVGIRGDKLIAVGLYGFLAESTDGSSWDILSEEPLEYLSSPLRDIACDPYGVCVAAGSGFLGWSDNTTNWTRVDIDWGLLAIRYLGDAFWAVDLHPTGMTVRKSSDGLRWEEVLSTPQMDRANDVAVAPDRVVAVGSGEDEDRYGAIVTMVFGEEPVVQEFHDVAGTFLSVVWTGRRFLASTPLKDGILKASEDGFNWYSLDIGRPIRVRWFEKGGGRIVASATEELPGDDVSLMLTTRNGGSWVASYVDAGSSSFRDLTWTGSSFVAAGRDQLLVTSRDGLNWVRSKVGYRFSPQCIAGDSSTLIVGGWGSGLLRGRYSAVSPRSGALRPPNDVSPIQFELLAQIR